MNETSWGATSKREGEKVKVLFKYDGRCTFTIAGNRLDVVASLRDLHGTAASALFGLEEPEV